MPRHHGVPGGRPGRRRLLGQRPPARHQRSEESEAARRRLGQELRVLALGDVQQRRHQGDLHRRVGRRRAPALPRDRSAELGRRRDLRHRRQEARVQGLLQDAGAADRAGELRRAQRIADSGARTRHHGAGVVPGRRLGVRLHRFDDAGRDRVLRPRADRREEPDARRLLVGLLVQRPDLRLGDRARDRHLQPAAERVPVAERARRGAR